MKSLKIIVPTIILLIIVWFAGPRLPHVPLNSEMPVSPLTIENVEDFVIEKEASYQLRPDNHARIVWANDTVREQTEFSILYLHGFSASWYEGYPAHAEMAKTLKANLYLSRLASHGIETADALIDMQPYLLYESAKEALLIAEALGNKVIVVGTSTGGTLALQLAADFPERVHALVLLSPNIAINNAGANLLSGPWGLQIARLIGKSGKHRHLDPGSETEQKYWYKTYRWEATVYLQQLIDQTMKKETFKKVEQPVFLAYYFKNETEQDQTVKVSAMLEMYKQLGTTEELKMQLALPNAGDHVIGCEETSGAVDELINEINTFLSQYIATF